MDANLKFAPTPPDEQKSVAAERFIELEARKADWLETARECSRLTKPMVAPPAGYTPGSPTKKPHQSHGSRLVSNLVSQLLLILFPPGVSFHKLDLESVDLKEMAKGVQLPAGKTMYDAMRETFVSLENNSAVLFDTMGIREKILMVLQQIIVSGASCFLDMEDTLELVPLEDWVVVRSSSGDPVEVIYRHCWTRVEAEDMGYPLSDQEKEQGYTWVYTWCTLVAKNRWKVRRYTGGGRDPLDSEDITVTNDKFWVHLPYWELTPGEDYGRGPVEESLGDIRTYESGTKIVKESASALAKVIFAVRPNGMTVAKDVAEAENCELISGDPEDVGVIQANKVYDMSGFIGFLREIKQDLDMSFMMPSIIRREAERVTAEEIRRMAAEFEKSRGGTYNSLARTLQAPVAIFLIRHLLRTSSSAYPNLKLSDIQPIVNTGLQGLGRSLELENFSLFLERLRLVPGLEQRLKHGQIIHKFAVLFGLELKDMIKTDEEISAEQQAAAMENMAQQVGPDIIKKNEGVI